MTHTEHAELRRLTRSDFDYDALMACARLLSAAYPFLGFSYLGESAAGRGIPLFSLGEGKKEVYYIGVHHGAERITGAILVQFLRELCAGIAQDAVLFGVNLAYLLRSRTLYILPMLNPDGAQIAAGKADKDSLFYPRLVAMHGSAEDFTRWQANVRGVDLNHNYNAGFDAYKQLEPSLGVTGAGPTRFAGPSPESEPEVGALCNFLRFNHPTALMTLHTQGREIYHTAGGKCPPGAGAAAKRLAALTGYRLAEPSGGAAYGGLTDYCIAALGIPAFTLECGKGQNPLPPTDAPVLYGEIRKALFGFPLLF